MNKLTRNTRIAIVSTAIIAAAVVAAILIVIATTQSSQPRPPAAVDGAETSLPSAIRDDTRILDKVPESTVTVVEFLDFECEACGAFYPTVEAVREKYAGQVTFAIRYYPIPSHFNSMNAAVAVESAARQGSLEPMYSKMFTTQAEWGEQSESRASLFRQYAEELGLDMAQYDADVADPAVTARVESDFDDGNALGVQGTPSFYVNDRLLELSAYGDLAAAIEDGLKQ